MSQYPPIDQNQLPMNPPVWPKVVGIISIVLASLGLLAGLCGTAQNLVSALSGSGQTMSNGVAMPPMPMTLVIVGGLSTLWSITLLVAGIMLIRRMPAGRSLHILYAAVSILLTVVNTAMSIPYLRQVGEAMQQDPNMAQMGGAVTSMMYGAMACGIGFGLAYPAFLLFWFLLMKKTPESMLVRPEQPLI